MRWNFVPNSNTRVLDLKSGEAQIADGIPFAQVSSLQGESGLSIQKVELPQEVLLVTNNKVTALGRSARPPRAQPRDQPRTAERSGVPRHRHRPQQRDPELRTRRFRRKKCRRSNSTSKKPRKKWRHRNSPKGFSVKLQYPAGFDYFKQMALLVQQEMGAIGVNVKLEEAEAATIAEKWLEGEFEMTFPFAGTTSDIPVPDEYAGLLRPAGSRTRRVQIVLDRQRNRRTGRRNSSPAPTKPVARREWKVIQEKFNEEMPSLNVMDFPLINGHAVQRLRHRGQRPRRRPAAGNLDRRRSPRQHDSRGTRGTTMLTYLVKTTDGQHRGPARDRAGDVPDDPPDPRRPGEDRARRSTRRRKRSNTSTTSGGSTSSLPAAVLALPRQHRHLQLRPNRPPSAPPSPN